MRENSVFDHNQRNAELQFHTYKMFGNWGLVVVAFQFPLLNYKTKSTNVSLCLCTFHTF